MQKNDTGFDTNNKPILNCLGHRFKDCNDYIIIDLITQCSYVNLITEQLALSILSRQIY